MDAGAILAAYDREMRADPAPEAGVERVWVDGVLRTLGAYDFIGWWDFRPARAAEIAAREADFFRKRGAGAEWKVFSHDHPAHLEAALAEAGWTGQEAETFVAFDMEEGMPPADRAAGLEIREARDRAGLADFLAVNAAAFARPARQTVEELERAIHDPGLAYFVAYREGRPVASGGLHLAPGRAFAGLYSGGVVPDQRGRGAYRALVAARAEQARRLGYRYLFVDARETSRPILERLGFLPLATIRGWTIEAPPSPLAGEGVGEADG
jgi:N-acetylglutamate synthase-like GNAT family acetyltransferase